MKVEAEPMTVLPESGADAIERDLVEQHLALAFLPLHKRAIGIAVGATIGLVIFALTAFHVILQPDPALNIALLSQYFYGYSVSWQGALIGAFWGFVVGFVAGWFTAFGRNLIIATLLFVGRTREELRATRDFLDHI